jgi:hypothetical protein
VDVNRRVNLQGIEALGISIPPPTPSRMAAVALLVYTRHSGVYLMYTYMIA